jgi:hypothetical protein
MARLGARRPASMRRSRAQSPPRTQSDDRNFDQRELPRSLTKTNRPRLLTAVTRLRPREAEKIHRRFSFNSHPSVVRREAHGAGRLLSGRPPLGAHHQPWPPSQMGQKEDDFPTTEFSSCRPPLTVISSTLSVHRRGRCSTVGALGHYPRSRAVINTFFQRTRLPVCRR